jgi:hypothetical protein
VFLERAVPLAKSLHRDIVSLGKRLEIAADQEESKKASGRTEETASGRERELRSVMADLKSLLARIDHDIPLLSLAISASGESLSTSVPPGVSPSRLLQASMLLNIGDTQYANTTKPVQIGPSFTLSLYMLFIGHSSTNRGAVPQSQLEKGTPGTPSMMPRKHGPESEEPYGFDENSRKPIWQEVIHKARVRLCRTPLDFGFDPSSGYGRRVQSHGGLSKPVVAQTDTAFSPDEFAYHLEIVEDLDDGRVHDEPGGMGQSYDSISKAGLRESIPIYNFSKLFYTDTGRILNIGNENDGDNNPVLLLKRDRDADRPARMRELLGVHTALAPSRPLLKSDDVSETSGEQFELDRQLREETESLGSLGREEGEGCAIPSHSLQLPAHLDPEWIALEVFEEDESSDSDESEDEMVSTPQPRLGRGTSLDSSIIDQIRILSTASPPFGTPGTAPTSPRKPLQDVSPERRPLSQECLVARSPFGAITTSLSLMEMLIRLTSLQEFQQMSHLAVPDHILTFFLEETSTTGLTGIERWKAHNQAKQRVGFDPYTDTT